MKKQLLLVCAIALCTITMNAQRWDNTSGDGMFTTATNWDGDVVPTDNGSSVEFVGGTNADNCTINTDITISKLEIQLTPYNVN